MGGGGDGGLVDNESPGLLNCSHSSEFCVEMCPEL